MIKLASLTFLAAMLLGACASPPAQVETTIAAPEKAKAQPVARLPVPLQPSLSVSGRQSLSPGPSIYFTPESSDVPVSALRTLGEWANRLKADSRRVLVLEAHTDDLGSPEYCLAIAEKWASYVKMSLVRQGVRPTQIQIHPYGSAESAPCNSERCRSTLRRVDLVERP